MSKPSQASPLCLLNSGISSGNRIEDQESRGVPPILELLVLPYNHPTAAVLLAQNGKMPPSRSFWNRPLRAGPVTRNDLASMIENALNIMQDEEEDNDADAAAFLPFQRSP